MVTHRPRRILTVEEARKLPPPTEEQLARRREAWDGLVAISRKILERRGGIPFSEEEFFEILDRDRDDDCDEDPD